MIQITFPSHSRALSTVSQCTVKWRLSRRDGAVLGQGYRNNSTRKMHE